MSDHVPEQPGGAVRRGPVAALRRWAEKKLSEPEPPPPGSPQPITVTVQVALIVAGLFALRMILTGAAWINLRGRKGWHRVWCKWCRHG